MTISDLTRNGRKLWVENTGGTGEIARYEQFLLFPQCFQKDCLPGVSKGVIVWDWVKQDGLENNVASSIFPLFHNVFFPFKNISHHFNNILIVVCKCFQIQLLQKFAVR